MTFIAISSLPAFWLETFVLLFQRTDSLSHWSSSQLVLNSTIGGAIKFSCLLYSKNPNTIFYSCHSKYVIPWTFSNPSFVFSPLCFSPFHQPNTGTGKFSSGLASFWWSQSTTNNCLSNWKLLLETLKLRLPPEVHLYNHNLHHFWIDFTVKNKKS